MLDKIAYIFMILIVIIVIIYSLHENREEVASFNSDKEPYPVAYTPPNMLISGSNSILLGSYVPRSSQELRQENLTKWTKTSQTLMNHVQDKTVGCNGLISNNIGKSYLGNIPRS